MSEEIIWTEEKKKIAMATCAKWRGTPHRNRIAIVGLGIDCIKFVNEILCDSEIIDRTVFGGYDLNEGMLGESERLIVAIESLLNVERVENQEYQFGDLMVFKTGGISGHCGFCDGERIWHALSGNYVTNGQMKLWIHRIEVIFRIKKTGLKENPQNFC